MSRLVLKPATLKLREMLLANDCVGNYGGIVCGKVGPSMSASDLKIDIDELDEHGIKVRRIDAGGSPKWALVD